ncbi:molybdopterin molybdotransferase MoeA [Candidatus Bathyarchaeota archaeon]|nr:MAG: molybdopterin molybdotransferase MoeA [Candidatus Bathyarchaeota archaeon]
MLARLKGFKKLTSINEALSRFLDRLQPRKLATVQISLKEALGRVTAKNINATKDLPPYHRSAVDGYALRAIDTVGASPYQPKDLRLVNKELGGERELREIWTGNTLPKGADSVVMLEHTERIGNRIQILVSLTPGANVSRKGEDVKKGDVVVKAGLRLRPHHLGLLAALENREVKVVRKPKVALLATGSELAPLGAPLKPNQIVEVNSIILSELCSELGAESFSLGIARDDEDEIRVRICEGLAEADLIITTGGTSVGVHDLVPRVIEQIEPHALVAHGIAMRPGMPTALAVVQRKPVLVLSGNPVAASVGFEVFARPTILRFLGIKEEGRARLKAKLTRRVAGVLGRRVILRVRVVEKDGDFLAEPIRIKGSSIITTMTKANGYVIIPEDREGLRENEVVMVHLFGTVREEQ